MDPQPVSWIDSPNTYLERLARLFYSNYSKGINYYGLLFVFIPLIILVAVFFLIRHYSGNKKALLIYSIISSVLYLIYFLGLLPRLMYVI